MTTQFKGGVWRYYFYPSMSTNAIKGQKLIISKTTLIWVRYVPNSLALATLEASNVNLFNWQPLEGADGPNNSCVVM